MLQENLIVSGGTCSLDASTNDTHVVQIVKHPGKYLCSQLILGANGLGKAIVTIQDVGLSPRATTHSLVHFFDIFFLYSFDTFCIEVNQAPSVAYYVCTCVHDLFSISLGIMITFVIYLLNSVVSHHIIRHQQRSAILPCSPL